MFCPKCGSKNEEDAKFCEKCGTNLNDDPEITTENTSSNVKYIIVIAVILVVGLGIAAAALFNSHASASSSTQTQNKITSQSNGFPLSDAPKLAVQIANTNGNTATVQYNGMTLDKNQCLYILSRAIVMINNGETGNIPIKEFSDASNPDGQYDSADITESEYVNMAGRTYEWMDSNGRSPNHTGIDSPGACDLSPDTTLKAFAEVLSEYQSTGQLPASISV